MRDRDLAVFGLFHMHIHHALPLFSYTLHTASARACAASRGYKLARIKCHRSSCWLQAARFSDAREPHASVTLQVSRDNFCVAVSRYCTPKAAPYTSLIRHPMSRDASKFEKKTSMYIYIFFQYLNYKYINNILYD